MNMWRGHFPLLSVQTREEVRDNVDERLGTRETPIQAECREQGRIHGHQLRTGGQGRKCAFYHFSTRSLRTDGPTDGPTDKASYRVACPQPKSRKRRRSTWRGRRPQLNRGKPNCDLSPPFGLVHRPDILTFERLLHMGWLGFLTIRTQQKPRFGRLHSRSILIFV